MEREQRTHAGAVECRATEGAPTTMSGYAAVYDVETVIAGAFRERIAAGAFDEAIVGDDVRALFNHDPNFVLGRTRASTLTLSTDATGLQYTVTPPDTTWARDLMVSVGRGDVNQSSFAFSVPAGGEVWDTSERGSGALPLRTITRATLFDVSPVTYPAYTETTVSARALAVADAAVMPEDDGSVARSRERLRFSEARTA